MRLSRGPGRGADLLEVRRGGLRPLEAGGASSGPTDVREVPELSVPFGQQDRGGRAHARQDDLRGGAREERLPPGQGEQDLPHVGDQFGPLVHRQVRAHEGRDPEPIDRMTREVETHGDLH